MAAAKDKPLRFAHAIFPVAHMAISFLFVVCGLALIVFACLQLWVTFQPGDTPITARLDAVLESLAVITVALAALELGETVLEEQVQRDTHKSAPTRVRRFLSRFMVVLVVALTIESLVLVFRYSHDTPENLPYAAVIAAAAAALTAAWGLFIWLNRATEELEPEGLREVKEEDKKMRRER